MGLHILVFDSGMGGTTILEEISKKLPTATFSYAMDNAAFPYGSKSNETLINRCDRLFEKLIEQARPDLVVLACNTASTLFLDRLRERFSVPFIGVVPAIKPAAEQSKTRTIGLLATQATISRAYVDKLMKDFGGDCKLVCMGSEKLVLLAENKMMGLASGASQYTDIVNDLRTSPEFAKIDTIVLGCTHFPAISKELDDVWPYPVTWIDSGEAIGRRARDLANQMSGTSKSHEGKLYNTQELENDNALNCLKNYRIVKTELIRME